METIFLLIESPLNDADYDRFGIEILSRSFKTIVFDCTSWIKPQFWERHADTNRCKVPETIIIGGINDLKNQIACLSDAIAIDYLGNCEISKSIRSELKIQNIPRAIFYSGPVPLPHDTLLGKVRTLIRGSNRCHRIFEKLYRALDANLRPLHPPDISMLSGEICLKYPFSRSTHQIWAHSFDYDVFLKHKNYINENSNPYALLLDENLVHHSDWFHWGIKAPVTEEYFSDLNVFIDKFEHITGLKVIIAGHPRSKCELISSYLKGRSVIPGKTAQLTRCATLVLGHVSTAISFAVLWRKPIIFITTNELQNSFLASHIEYRSKILNAPLVNVSHDVKSNIDLKVHWEVDESAYATYQRQYIKRPGTPDCPSWEIFTNYVLQNY